LKEIVLAFYSFGRLIAFIIPLFIGLTASKLDAAEISSSVWIEKNVHITVKGPIVSGDENAFKSEVLRWLKKDFYIGGVQLYSRGGDVRTALNIGRQIRLLNATTVGPNLSLKYPGSNSCTSGGALDQTVVYYNPKTGDGDDDCMCASSCFLIWAGGVGRNAGAMGVHRPRFDQQWYSKLDPATAESYYSATTADIKKYLAEMDVPTETAALMFAYPSSGMYYLSARELALLDNTPTWYVEQNIAKCGVITPTQAYYKCVYPIAEARSKDFGKKYLDTYGR
jgi:hypothetical protein